MVGRISRRYVQVQMSNNNTVINDVKSKMADMVFRDAGSAILIARNANETACFARVRNRRL